MVGKVGEMTKYKRVIYMSVSWQNGASSLDSIYDLEKVVEMYRGHDSDYLKEHGTRWMVSTVDFNGEKHQREGPKLTDPF